MSLFLPHTEATGATAPARIASPPSPVSHLNTHLTVNKAEPRGHQCPLLLPWVPPGSPGPTHPKGLSGDPLRRQQGYAIFFGWCHTVLCESYVLLHISALAEVPSYLLLTHWLFQWAFSSCGE